MPSKFLSPVLTAAALVAMFSTTASAATATNFVQAPGSTLVFATSYDGETFTGKFGKFDTKVSFDPMRPDLSTIDVTIGLAGTATGNGDRDSTLAGEDFFNVGKFAQATYKAKGFKPLGGNRYSTDGTLTLRGVSKPVTLTFQWTPGAQPTLTGKATLKRLDFGVGGGDWKDTSTIPDAVAVSTKVVLKPAN
ncbi:Polyisoprenoid-binding protein YceI [Pseudoxanthomonas sp. GM95]|uniref:YceI family protein n=1 Tax=Pseudoxanthomonas sp. GM95 TaxID=1881043 RepID=UPI0008BEBC1A|nr:YceI family protein [Pseudoxanthomonas sp. GM95]SEL65339.1 Polyisoprenoid-binding protein YceI [Pseudoxanthomonas sp. GM95]